MAELRQAFDQVQEAKIVTEKRWLKAKGYIEELEVALEGDAGNVIYFAEQQALAKQTQQIQELKDRIVELEVKLAKHPEMGHIDLKRALANILEGRD